MIVCAKSYVYSSQSTTDLGGEGFPSGTTPYGSN